ncbi:hypothetical protein DB347_01395 [Opitutaceae bacterium EW11]|nr:hypothetical protein DB347_01395 [Opitutaceae bacterium EW11]
MKPPKFPAFHLLSVSALWMSVALSARADAAADLKTVLSKLDGQEPLKAHVDYTVSSTSGDEDKKSAAKAATVSAQIEAGPEGLRILWSREQIESAEDSTKSNPQVGRAMNELSATHLNGYLNGASEMLRNLERAQLTEEKSVSWESHPARLLVFKITPELSEKDRKYIKQLDTQARIWIGADGVPLAAEKELHVKGRALLVITFEQTEKEQYRFQRVGNRLVVVQHLKESAGSGGGESGQQTSRADLKVEKS